MQNYLYTYLLQILERSSIFFSFLNGSLVDVIVMVLKRDPPKNGDKRNPILIAYNTRIFNTIVFIIENMCSRRHEHLINQ